MTKKYPICSTKKGDVNAAADALLAKQKRTAKNLPAMPDELLTDAQAAKLKDAMTPEVPRIQAALVIEPQAPVPAPTVPQPAPQAAIPISEAHALAAEVPDLRASVANLQNALQARTKERDDARDALARTKILMSALERSFGLGAAQTIVQVPSEHGQPVIDRFNSMPDGPEKTSFYKAHREEILKFINKDVKPQTGPPAEWFR